MPVEEQVTGCRVQEQNACAGGWKMVQGGPFDWPHQNLAKSKMIHDT